MISKILKELSIIGMAGHGLSMAVISIIVIVMLIVAALFLLPMRPIVVMRMPVMVVMFRRPIRLHNIPANRLRIVNGLRRIEYDRNLRIGGMACEYA